MSVGKTVFLFSGQGSHHIQMGADLYRGDRVVREIMQRMDRLVEPVVGRSLLGMLYGDGRVGTAFARTLYTHPAIFMVEYALSRSLIERGWEQIFHNGKDIV